MSKPLIKYQKVKVTVASAGAVLTIEAETDKRYKYVTGINFLSTNKDAVFSEIQLDIGSEEIAPEQFEVLRYLVNAAVPADFQYKTILAEGAGSKIKGTYKDVNLGLTVYPYSFIISLRLENEPNGPLK